MIRVAVVASDPGVRQALLEALSRAPDLHVVSEAGSAEEALRSVEEAVPDIALIDLRLPGPGGSGTCRRLRERRPAVRTILFAGEVDDDDVLEAFAAGARGLLLKRSPPEVVRAATRMVAAGGTFVDPAVAATLVRLALTGRPQPGPFDLTIQELRVAEWLPRGATDREIGEGLGIPERIVGGHVGDILRKLRATDRVEAAAVVKRYGLA